MNSVRIDTASGLLEHATHLESPNCDARPTGIAPDLIVIHSISLPPGQYAGGWIEKFFCNQLDTGHHPYFAEIAELRVSAHLLIARSGEIVQFVPFHRRAWHAGESEYCGRKACNDFSIGIELEGTDRDDFEEIQYQRLADVVVALCNAYPDLAPERITGHSEIAPGRKTDPGAGFDWPRLRRMMQERLQDRTA